MMPSFCEGCGERIHTDGESYIAVHGNTYHVDCFEPCEEPCDDCAEVVPKTQKDDDNQKADDVINERREQHPEV